jgi:hypothetical protein
MQTRKMYANQMQAARRFQERRKNDPFQSLYHPHRQLRRQECDLAMHECRDQPGPPVFLGIVIYIDEIDRKSEPVKCFGTVGQTP